MDDPNDWRFRDFHGVGSAYNRTLAVDTPSARAQFDAPSTPSNVTASSRVIPSPSGTNWSQTFGYNQPASPSGTDWQKTFGSRSTPSGSQPQSNASRFDFNLSGSDDRSGLSLVANLTKRDHELYGAGDTYGFNIL